MAYGSKDVDTTESKGSKFISKGVQFLKINKVEFRPAKTGSKIAILHMESEPVSTPGWEGHEGAKGLIGMVNFPKNYMMDGNKENEEYMSKVVGILGDKFGVRKEVDAIKADGFEDYLTKVFEFIKGKYAWWAITDEEYWNTKNDKLGHKLAIAKYGFIATKEEGKDHVKFDLTSDYYYKPYAKQAPVKTDLPF